jgi:hypothetical protein
MNPKQQERETGMRIKNEKTGQDRRKYFEKTEKIRGSKS